MDLEAQRKFALAVCDSKRTRKQYIALKRKFVLSCNRARRASPSSSYDCDDCAVSNSAFVGSPRVIGGSQQKSKVFNVLDELWRVSQVPKNRRRFSAALIAFAMSVYLLSGTAYEHLRKFMPLPSWQTLQVRTQPCFKFNANTLHNLSMIPDTVDRFREQEQIGHEIVYGILAVDAVSFQRELIVTKNGMMEGSLSNETLDSAKLAELHESFTEFENFWKLHHDAIISDAFVFQFQPINASLRSFIVHIKPSTQGKRQKPLSSCSVKLINDSKVLTWFVWATLWMGTQLTRNYIRRFTLTTHGRSRLIPSSTTSRSSPTQDS